MSVRSLWDLLRARQGRSATPRDVPAATVAIVRVIGEDADLQSWFRRLVALPVNLRVSEIGRLVAEMRANGEDQELIGTFTTPGEIETCRTVARVLRDRYGVRIKITEK